MSIVVDHKERRQEILRKTLHLIGERSYPEVTYQQIADECGLNRTLLYKYYHNKREIFDEGMLNMVSMLGEKFENALRAQPNSSACDKIRLLIHVVIDQMFTDPPLLQAIIEYLISLRRCGEPVAKRVRRHTVALHRLIQSLVLEGIANGELKPVDCALAAESLYSMIEVATLRITLTENADREQLIRQCEHTLNCMKAER